MPITNIDQLAQIMDDEAAGVNNGGKPATASRVESWLDSRRNGHTSNVASLDDSEKTAVGRVTLSALSANHW